MPCVNNPLNGSGGFTEGGRLEKKIDVCSKKYVNGNASSPFCFPPYKNRVQAVITPAESTRINDLAQGCVRGVSQDRIQQLLSGPKNYSSQDVRIAAIQKAVITCSPPPTVPVPIIVTPCPPLPPPPGPPYVCSPSRVTR